MRLDLTSGVFIGLHQIRHNILTIEVIKIFQSFHVFFRPYDPDKFWFLKDKVDEGQEAMDSCSTTSSTLKKDEQARIKIKNILVKIESGVGNNTIPLLLLESSLDCNISDFYNNKRMTLIGNLSVQMAYYNANLALWEPVIEPIVTEYKPNGSVVTKRWDMKVTLQQNSNTPDETLSRTCYLCSS